MSGPVLDLMPCFGHLVPLGPWLPASVPLLTPSPVTYGHLLPDAPACPSAPPPLQTLVPRICTWPQASPGHPLLPGSLPGLSIPALAQVAEQGTLRETVALRQACLSGQPGTPEWGVGYGVGQGLLPGL